MTQIKAPGFIPITHGLMKLVLDLPADLTICGVRPSSRYPDTFEIVVAGDRVPPGAELTPIYRRVEPGQADLAVLHEGKELQDLRGLARV